MSAPGLRIERDERVLRVAFDRPERKNALTFEIYEALRDTFRGLADDREIRAVALTGTNGDFSSGGDVRDIIGPLTRSTAPELLAFTQMTGEVVKAMQACPQPIVAAVDGVCAGAGAILALASDVRHGTTRAQVAFLFVRVGLAGSDMGACAMLPRVIGLGRATELLLTGRAMTGDEALTWGFFNALHDPNSLVENAWAVARMLAEGPSLAHAMTKKMLRAEWNMDLDAAIDAEAKAQAELMQTSDFRRAYEAFAEKRAPLFEGD